MQRLFLGRRLETNFSDDRLCPPIVGGHLSNFPAPFGPSYDAFFFADKISILPKNAFFARIPPIFAKPLFLYPQILSMHVLYSETFATFQTLSRRSNCTCTCWRRVQRPWGVKNTCAFQKK